MVSNIPTMNQVSHEFESAFSEILPDLYQLLQQYQQYQISETFKMVLFDLVHDSIVLNSCMCGLNYQKPCNCPPRTTTEPGLDSETAEQLCAEIDSILFTILPRLSESAQQIDESFEVHFSINPAAVNNSCVSCEFVDGVLVCSDQPQ